MTTPIFPFPFSQLNVDEAAIAFRQENGKLYLVPGRFNDEGEATFSTSDFLVKGGYAEENLLIRENPIIAYLGDSYSMYMNDAEPSPDDIKNSMDHGIPISLLKPDMRDLMEKLYEFYYRETAERTRIAEENERMRLAEEEERARENQRRLEEEARQKEEAAIKIQANIRKLLAKRELAKLEKERLRQLEEEKRAAEAELERIRLEKEAAERELREKEEADRLAKEAAERERLKKEEADRLAREAAEKELREKEEADRLAREAAERERLKKEAAELKRIRLEEEAAAEEARRQAIKEQEEAARKAAEERNDFIKLFNKHTQNGYEQTIRDFEILKQRNKINLDILNGIIGADNDIAPDFKYKASNEPFPLDLIREINHYNLSEIEDKINNNDNIGYNNDARLGLLLNNYYDTIQGLMEEMKTEDAEKEARIAAEAAAARAKKEQEEREAAERAEAARLAEQAAAENKKKELQEKLEALKQNLAEKQREILDGRIRELLQHFRSVTRKNLEEFAKAVDNILKDVSRPSNPGQILINFYENYKLYSKKYDLLKNRIEGIRAAIAARTSEFSLGELSGDTVEEVQSRFYDIEASFNGLIIKYKEILDDTILNIYETYFVEKGTVDKLKITRELLKSFDKIEVKEDEKKLSESIAKPLEKIDGYDSIDFETFKPQLRNREIPKDARNFINNIINEINTKYGSNKTQRNRGIGGNGNNVTQKKR